jgi:hypothetical protein
MSDRKILCICDSFKPAEIKTSNWIKKGEVYTVLSIHPTPIGDFYFKLAEVNPECPPYMGYNVKRFVPLESITEVIKELEEIENI